MLKGVKLSLAILVIIFLISSISAYNSFILLKENPRSYDAVVISNIEYSNVRNNPGTIIQLTENDIEYTDLIAYIRTSKITKIFYYSHDDISSETLRLIKEEGGVDVRMLVVRESELNNNGKEEIDNEKNSIEDNKSNEIYNPITANAINEQKSDKNNLFLIFSIIFLLIAFIILCLIIKRKRK